MANGISPYQVAGPTTRLIQQSKIKESKEKQADVATKKQMGEMEEEFYADMEKLGIKASDAAGKYDEQDSYLSILGLLGNPLLSGILGAFTSGRKTKQKRKAMKGLLDIDERYGKTFLRGDYRDYLSEARSMQVDKGDIFKNALTGGFSSAMLSKMLGSSRPEGGILRKTAQKFQDVGGEGKWGGLFKGVGKTLNPFEQEGLFQPNRKINIPEAPMIGPQTRGVQFTDRLRGLWGGSKNLLEPLTTGVSQFGQQGFNQGGKGGQMMESLMPLLMLLQMLEGE